MAAEDDIKLKIEFDDSNFYYSDYKDEEKNETNQFNDSIGELVSINTPDGGNIQVYLKLANKVLFCSEKYFYIERTTAETNHEKECMGIIGICHTCAVRIRGSLKVSSNFISHLKGRHPEIYQDFLKQKQQLSHGAAIKRSKTNHRTSPYLAKGQILKNILQHESDDKFQRNVLQFLIGTNQPLSLVEDAYFLRLFDFPSKLKKSFQYAQIVRDECKCKQLQIANFFSNSEAFISLTADAWSFGKCKYIAVSSHWIDDRYQRRTALLACLRSPIEHNKQVKLMLNDIVLNFELRKDYIVSTVTENIQNYIFDFMEIGVHKDVLYFDYYNPPEDSTDLRQMQKSFKILRIENSTELNFIQLDFLKLNKIWGIGFIRDINEVTKHVHDAFMEKCSLIWKKCHSLQFQENFRERLNGALILPDCLNFISIYKALKQLFSNKSLLIQICTFLEMDAFTKIELDYLDELMEVFEPLNAALEFLDMPQNHYYGCFLPTLVTLKWKLTRLYNSKKLHYLQKPLFKLKEQLLSDFQPYYELSDTKSEAIIAALTYPPVKTRFLTGLQETASWDNLQTRNFLLKYGKKFHSNNEFQADNSTMPPKQENYLENSIAAEEFFDFGDAPEDYEAPQSLKLEIDAYLADNDNTLISLQKYPTIKKMFLRFNTCIPSPSSVFRLLALSKIIKTSLVTPCTHEQFGDYIFYQSHLLDKI